MEGLLWACSSSAWLSEASDPNGVALPAAAAAVLPLAGVVVGAAAVKPVGVVVGAAAVKPVGVAPLAGLGAKYRRQGLGRKDADGHGRRLLMLVTLERPDRRVASRHARAHPRVHPRAQQRKTRASSAAARPGRCGPGTNRPAAARTRQALPGAAQPWPGGASAGPAGSRPDEWRLNGPIRKRSAFPP